MKQFWFHIKKNHKGQSFVELAVVFVFLMVLLTGVVELGSLLNAYINLIDGARAGARWGSSSIDPFIRKTVPFGIDETFFTQITEIIEGDPLAPPGTAGAIAPIVLNPAQGDNIIISFFSISGKTALRFPYAGGWKKYKHDLVATAFTNADIVNRLDSNAPDTGILLVEIFYHYNQILKMPYFSALPDAIPVRTYAIMPLSAAEPTPTPIP